MLTKSTEYAIRALVFIQLRNIENKRPGVIEIAEMIEAPTAFTAKILHTVSKHGLIESMKGRGGGFFFDNSREELTLYKVIVLMEGDSVFTRCGFGLKSCKDARPCPLHEKYAPIREGYLNIAQTETIQSLATKIMNGKAALNSIGTS